MALNQNGEREGGDITAQDMIEPEQEPSQIKEFYDETSVFITGASGFLGKLLLEKILHSCTGVRKVYLLIREKKGKEAAQRLEELFKDVVFERIQRQNPDAILKVSLIQGDLTRPDLGLSDSDKKLLISEVNCVFHCAATVRFDEKIRVSANVNVRATRDLIKIARGMKHLRSFVYVSTAYSNCNQKIIDETFYEPHLTGEKLLRLVDDLDTETLDQITPFILKDWPNTYAFSKAVAENIVETEGKGLPLAIVRPSIVMSTANEPMAGWIDNYYGACGVSVGTALGLIRVMHVNHKYTADLVPADYVVNCVLCVAWETGATKILNKNEELAGRPTRQEETNSGIGIYNFISSNENPLSWDDFQKKAEPYLADNYSTLQIWSYFLIPVANKQLFTILTFLLHMLPAYVIDGYRYCIGKKPRMVKAYDKIQKFLTVISQFSTKQWKFRNDNTRALWDKMNSVDRRLFEFSITRLDWDSFFSTYVRGARVYLLKDPLETIPEGKIHNRKLKILHYLVCGTFAAAALKLLQLVVAFMLF